MQSYKNHVKISPMFHGVLYFSLLAFLICAVINLSHHINAGDNSLQPWLFVAVGVIFFLFVFFVRSFPLQAQDRIIRAEENMRHYILTGNPLDKQLTIGQIIALRFASDAEFPALAQRAVRENLSSKNIKMAVKDWRADNHRM